MDLVGEARKGSLDATSSSLSLVPNREFRFTSEVPIWLDYHGKHVTVDQVVSRTPWLVLLSRTHKSAQRKAPPAQAILD